MLYYREKMINGIFHYKTSPNEKWVEMSKEMLSRRILEGTNIKQPCSLVIEDEIIDTIFSCVDIRGIELEFYRRNFTEERSGLITALNKLFHNSL